MAKKGSAGTKTKSGYAEDLKAMETALTHHAGRPSSLLDTRVVYCGLRRAQSSRDNLEQLEKLPDRCPQRRRSRSERSAVRRCGA